MLTSFGDLISKKCKYEAIFQVNHTKTTNQQQNQKETYSKIHSRLIYVGMHQQIISLEACHIYLA